MPYAEVTSSIMKIVAVLSCTDYYMCTIPAASAHKPQIIRLTERISVRSRASDSDAESVTECSVSIP